MTYPSSFSSGNLSHQRRADWQQTTNEMEGYRGIIAATAPLITATDQAIARSRETTAASAALLAAADQAIARSRETRDSIALQGEFAQTAAMTQTTQQIFDREGETLTRNGAGLARMGQALGRQDEALARNGAALARNDEALAREGEALNILQADVTRLEQQMSITTPAPADSSNSVIGGLMQGIEGGLGAIKRFFFRLIESIKKLLSS
jgi:hypothetical protein